MRVLFRSVLATLQQSTARPIPSSQDEIGRRLHSRRNRDRVASSAPVLRIVRRALLVECLAAFPALVRLDEEVEADILEIADGVGLRRGGVGGGLQVAQRGRAVAGGGQDRKSVV